MTASVAVDQLTKTAVRAAMAVCPDAPLGPCDRLAILGPIGLLRTENGASALGLAPSVAVLPLLMLALVLLFAQMRIARLAPLAVVAFGLQLGGLASNLIDRAIFGAVTDFIHVQVGSPYQGLVANPADIALAAGGLVGAMALVRRPGQLSQPSPA